MKLIELETNSHSNDIMILTRRSSVTPQSFMLEIHLECGFDLLLLLTNEEAEHVISVARMHEPHLGMFRYNLRSRPGLPPCSSNQLTLSLLNLPRELRIQIYTYALPKGVRIIDNGDELPNYNFIRGIGDLSGFYFPLGRESALLRVNKQIRHEALSLAYRYLIFRSNDIDSLIRLLVAVGRVGRDNIESLELTWESKADAECKWEEAPSSDPFLTLPTLHTIRFVELLKQCKRLKSLRLCFNRDLIDTTPPAVFKSDRGILALCAVRGLRDIQIRDTDHELFEHYDSIDWLKEQLESFDR